MNESPSILVIEDDVDALANLCDILSLDGYDVVGVASLGEAKRAAQGRNFGIAISDRKLPDGMIEELLPELRGWLDGSEIIVVTGFADMQSTITAFRSGVTDYVIKPIIPDDLRRTVRRIAEKKRLERELEREHEFADLVLKTAEAIVLVLDLEGRVIQFNPYFRQLTGWQPEDLQGKSWFDHCVLQEERERIEDVFARTAEGLDSRGVMNTVIGKDGSYFQVRWSNTTLRNGHEKVDAVLAVGLDVTDLTSAQARALQAERLAAIGQTMTALAHESRNALQRIQAATEMLELEVEGNENARQDLRSIRRASNDLKCLLEEVRSFAAPIHLRRSRTRLPDIWRRVWEDLSASHCERDVSLVDSVSSCDAEIEVDVLRLEQVFRNLFENALAACQDPVRIELQCRVEPSQISLTVTDNGPGMNEAQLSQLFEPFFTTKQSGTGLGLAICQRIVQAHGGTIAAHPCSDGAQFELQLPRTEPKDVKRN